MFEKKENLGTTTTRVLVYQFDVNISPDHERAHPHIKTSLKILNVKLNSFCVSCLVMAIMIIAEMVQPNTS